MRASIRFLVLAAPLFTLPSTVAASPGERATLSLAGEWTVTLDPEDVGLEARWFAGALSGQPIELPGTTDLAGIGYALDPATMTYPVPFEDSRFPGFGPVKRADESGHLTRTHVYIGAAWYQRTVHVPEGWSGKNVQLLLERVMWGSHVWIDERPVGHFDSLVAEHRYDLGSLEPGEHRLTVRVDNGLVHPIGIIGHAYGPETQTRWNGMIGRIELSAAAPVRLGDLQGFPAADRGSVRVEFVIENGLAAPADAKLRLALLDGGEELAAVEHALRLEAGTSSLVKTLPVEAQVRGWDEFDPKTYTLVATLTAGGTIDELRRPLGFRQLRREKRHLYHDDRRIFLRGTLDCCVYPRTGHPPMTTPEWLEVLGTIREHGFNHVRFHSWCPPEAAFEAADQLGLYLQPETSFWVDNWTSEIGLKPKLLGFDEGVTEYVRSEIERISRAYGNHPSFAFFCIGNEFGMKSDWDVANQLIDEAKRKDGRHLYNATTARKTVPADDFWVTHSAHGKASRGFGRSYTDGTDWDFFIATEISEVPVIAHETGQRPVFPDYDDLLPKFSPHLQPHELRRFRRQLEEAGMLDQVEDFERASARFQYLQYKAEHEAFLRTNDMAGYQLLMLGDFTGQSEALVGLLDPFLESKGVVSAEEIRRWNAPTVVLARFVPRVLSGDDEYPFATLIAFPSVRHHGPTDLEGVETTWTLTSRTDGRVLATGNLPPVTVRTGGITPLGEIGATIPKLPSPTAAIFRVRAGEVSNQWTLWVYPTLEKEPEPDPDTVVTDRFDVEALDALERGKKVLLLANGLENDNTKRTGFASVYWSAGWWGDAFSHLGILCDPTHPALAGFPNDGHSDWQWLELTEGATTFRLEGAPAGFRPIVQPVTDFHHNRLLGQLFEARVGKGRLLVSGYDLETKLHERVAARQLRRSLIGYLRSEDFQPEYELPEELLRKWLYHHEEVTVVDESEVPTGKGEFHVLAAFRLEEKHVDRPWKLEYDQPLFLSSTPTWEVRGGCWADDVGCAWHGNPLEVTIQHVGLASTGGVLYAHLHDWNELGRRGKLIVEGRTLTLGAHGGDGVWVALPVSAEDLSDNRIELRAEPTTGPNLMITECLFVRDEE